MEKERISAFQFGVLVFMCVVSSATLLIPTLVASYVRQDAWIVTIIGLVAGVLIVQLHTFLGIRYPDLTLIEYCGEILGKWLGKAVSLSFIFYFFIMTAVLLRQLGDMLTALIITETPIQWVEVLFFSIVVLAVRLGIEVSARAAEIFFPWLLLFLTLLFLLLLPLIKVENIQPVLETEWNFIAKGSLIHLGVPFFDLVILLMVFPNVSNVRKAKKAYLLGTIIGSFFIISTALLSILILGVDITMRSIYPVYTLAKMVEVGQFIQRIEALVGGIWFITLFFKIMVCFYACVLGIAQVSNLQSYRPLTLPLGMLIVPFSLIMFSNIVEFREFASEIWTLSVAPYSIFFPCLLLGVDVIKKRRYRGKQDVKE